MNLPTFSFPAPLFRRLFCLPLLAAALASTAHAALGPVKLAWNKNPENNVNGYELRYGTSPGKHPKKIDVGNKTSATVSGLEENTTYYFVVVARNRAGLSSPKSAEITWRSDTRLPQPPNGKIDSPAQDIAIYSGESVNFQGSGSDPFGNTPLEYRWRFGGGIPNSTAENPGAVRFDIPGTYTVTLEVTNSRGLKDPSPATRIITVSDPPYRILSRQGWTLQHVTSEEPAGYAAVQAFDGDPATFWQTEWRTPRRTPPPHDIQIDLGKLRSVSGFQYLPRQDSYNIGNIARYEFYVSTDGKNWGKPAATGAFEDSSNEKQVFFAQRPGRYIRLRSLAEVNGFMDSTIAELQVLEGFAPVAESAAVRTSKNSRVKVRLEGGSASGRKLIYKLVGKPKHGTVILKGRNIIYRPDRGFKGTEIVKFRVIDGSAASKIAKVSIKVKGNQPKKRTLSHLASAAPKTGVEVIGGEKFRVITIWKSGRDNPSARDVQVSGDLLDWFTGKNHTTVLVDNRRYLKVRDNTPLRPGQKRHIRLKRSAR